MNVRTLWAGNRIPVTILLDDPTPCRNPMWYEYPDDGHEAVIPLGFLERFADMCSRTGAAGKFSVVPCPGSRGRVDQAVPDIAAEDLERFLALVRERIAPRWSIGPEMLTHGKAIDLDSGIILAEREDTWAASQAEPALTRYISHALQILRNAGLEPTGVTSPWAFGIEVEDAYTRAIATALHVVCGAQLGWYFLHSDIASPYVAPRLIRGATEHGSALVSIVSGQRDWLWRTQYGEEPLLDDVLARDGNSGRLAALFAAESPIVFTTHWQSLFSNGTGLGLAFLSHLCERLNHLWGDRVRWTSTYELARYTSASASLRCEQGKSAHDLRLLTPFDCPEFTLVVDIPPTATTLMCDGRRLLRYTDGQITLAEGTWSRFGRKAHVCLALHDAVELSWQS